MSQRVLLPKDVQPKRYHLHLTPNLAAFTFAGKERAEVVVNTATNKIVIHSNDIEVTSAQFTAGGKQYVAKTITYEKSEEQVVFTFEDSLPVGNGELNLEFTGNLNDKMAGFYRSKYIVNNETRYMATTQFEATDARRAFPCWDEPAIKAVFNIKLSFPEKLMALSNMPAISETVSNGVKTVAFAETPIMSTYLVAFVVGEFDQVEGKTKEGVVVKVFTPLGKKEQGTFALDVATKTLSYFSEYFGIPYPLPKLDMIAIADFAAGAMENWGLVTYRETALLIDAKSSGVSSKQRVAYVVAHELAHQWFGNIVTMEWWKELWLNEGFATFVGNQAVDHLFPEWDIWTQFVSQYFNRALDLDGLESSHPIEVEVHHSGEINEIFDAISYCKGASVIRMVANHLGEEAFRKGLNIYLNRHKYKNAVTEDLWQALSESSGFSVNQFMDNWTKTTGYPLVSVTAAPGKDQFHVHQSRFFSNGTVQKETEAQKWWIALTLLTPNQKPVIHQLKDFKDTVTVPGGSDAEWLKVNAGQSGFYRTKYAAELIPKLSKGISNLQLNTVDRLGIQNDAFALAKAGFLGTVEALNIAKAYGNEVDYTVWSDLAGSLGEMATVWSAEPNYPHFKAFVRQLFTPISKTLGWEAKPGESDLQSLLRPVVLSQLGSNGDEAVIQEAKKKFAESLTNKDSIPADLRYIVYKLTVANGTETEWNQVLNIYKTADMSEEKIRALRALGQSHDPALITKSLELSLTDDVRAQDMMYSIASAASSPVGREITWKFLQQNWDGFWKRLGDSQFLLGRIISYATKDFVQDEKAEEVERFFATHQIAQAERTIKQSIESIRANSKWLNRNRQAVADFLASYN